MKSTIFLNEKTNVLQNVTLKKHSTALPKEILVQKPLPEVIFITSYPPVECGIASYSQDLLQALNNKFQDSFSLKVCAVQPNKKHYDYPQEVSYVIEASQSADYAHLIETFNNDENVKLILIQHEFGLFNHNGDKDLLPFLYSLTKPIVMVFHTVLPEPSAELKIKVRHLCKACAALIVMTQDAAKVLEKDYSISADKINVIPHGTHLVPHLNKDVLKAKYHFQGRKIISTFGLLNSGKSIETTLRALPSIIEQHRDILFLIIGKTHSGVVKVEGERYRHMLRDIVHELNLHNHVQFVNSYVPLSDLLEYLQMTDIYLFTSKDPNQAVSGTFSYAMSCGCPIISTPIPHAKEILTEGTGIIIDFENSRQLSTAVNLLMSDEALRDRYKANALHKIVPTVWENSAIAHALLLEKVANSVNNTDDSLSKNKFSINPPSKMTLTYRLPPINLHHVHNMTTDFGFIQFAKINQPDLESGFTLDDNARALIAMCMHYDWSKNAEDLVYIKRYLHFIHFCLQPEGNFLNYVDKTYSFTPQNDETNLADSNGRAIWAVGFLLSQSDSLPVDVVEMAESIMQRALLYVDKINSPRSMAFVIKGLYFYNVQKNSFAITHMITLLADKLSDMYLYESSSEWLWFESYITYGNSILCEALLYAYLETKDTQYRDIAKSSFDFLLSLTFNDDGIKVISNKTWLHKGEIAAEHGEQPIDVAYTILALKIFYSVFKEESYQKKLSDAFDWFLGKNHLNQIIYNPCTGGCYDGLEDTYVNLNQGAESTLSYLMARLVVEKK